MAKSVCFLVMIMMIAMVVDARHLLANTGGLLGDTNPGGLLGNSNTGGANLLGDSNTGGVNVLGGSNTKGVNVLGNSNTGGVNLLGDSNTGALAALGSSNTGGVSGLVSSSTVAVSSGGVIVLLAVLLMASNIPVEKDQSTASRKKKVSEAWNHFDRLLHENPPRDQCKYCKTKYAYGSWNNTSDNSY